MDLDFLHIGIGGGESFLISIKVNNTALQKNFLFFSEM